MTVHSLGGVLELRELVDHRRQFVLVAGPDAADDLAHGSHSQGREDRVEFRCRLVDFIVRFGFGDDATPGIRVGGTTIGGQLGAADGDHPPAVAPLVAPAHRARVEPAVAFEFVDQLGRGIGRYTAHRGRGMQGERQIQCSGGFFAQPAA